MLKTQVINLKIVEEVALALGNKNNARARHSLQTVGIQLK